MKKSLPYIAVIVAMIIWSGSGIAVKAALNSFAPLTLVLSRFTFGVLLMLAIGLIANRTTSSNSILRLQPVEKQHIWFFVLGGVFEPFLYFIFETYSYKLFATPTIAEAFLSTNPLIAPVFAFFFLREKVTFWNILGILVSTGGMLLLVLAGNDSFVLGSVWAIPLSLITVCMAVAYSIILKKVPKQYSSLTTVFWMDVFALCMFYLVAGAKAILNPHAVWLVSEISGAAVGGVSYLAVLSTVTAFILFCYSVRFLGVTKANIFNNIRPVFTALIMLCFFHEHMPLLKWIGIGIIVIGLFICQKRGKK